MKYKKALLLLCAMIAVLLTVAGGTALGTDTPNDPTAKTLEDIKRFNQKSELNSVGIEPTATDTTPPSVLSISPGARQGFLFCTGGTPVSVELDSQDPDSAISAISAEVNGNAVPLSTVTGLGTGSVIASGSFTANSIGAYTLNGHATSLGGTGDAAANFSVDLNIWLFRLSAQKTDTGESTVPIKFGVRDCKRKFVHDESVKVVVSEITDGGDIEALNGQFGEGPSTVRIDDKWGYYLINFQAAPGAHEYRLDLYFNDYNGNPFKQHSTTFSVH